MKVRNKDSPIIYICSPYSGDVNGNLDRACRYSRFAVDEGCVPITPHLYLPLFLSEETERELAISLDLRLMDVCRELWVCGDVISEGMAIEESVQKINGEVVETFQREICDGNTNLEIEAGTTGYKGGCCRNAGGRTYLSLLCLSGDFFFGPIKDDEGNIAGITIACCGDDGLNAIMKALEFAHEAINDQRCEVDD